MRALGPLTLSLLVLACGSGGAIAPVDGGRGGATATGGGGGGGGATASGGSGGATGAGGAGGGAGGSIDAGTGGSIDAGAGGSIDAGGGGAGGGLKVMYTCRSTGFVTIIFNVSVVNVGSAPLALSDLKLRYWYKTDLQPDQIMGCNTAPFGCANVTSAFTALDPMQGTANEYLEIGFLEGAGSVGPSQQTGDISVIVYTGIQHSPLDQTDDYSFDCSMMNTPIEATKITAYLRGALVSGIEP